MSDLVLDGFAGAGGWDLALHALGLTAHGVENAPAALATREATGLVTIAHDMWATPLALLEQYPGQVMSPPCTKFSQAGHGVGRKNLDKVLGLAADVAWMSLSGLRAAAEIAGDEHFGLVLTPLWHALHGEAEWICWEQVPPVLPVWKACAEILRTNGWNVWTGYVHSEQHGVGQTRKRAVLIGSRVRQVGAPKPTHSKFHSHDPSKLDPGVLKWRSMAEVLGWGCEGVMRSNYGTGGDPANRGLRSLTEPAPTVTPKTNRNVISLAMGDVRSSRGTLRTVDQPAPTLTASMDNGNFQWVDREGVILQVKDRLNNQSGTEFDLAWPADRPAPTVAGREIITMPGANANRFNGATKSRNDGIRVTPAEAGVLQSFPADYPWQGNKGEQYLQVGNAIPPLMAMHIIAEASGRPLPELTHYERERAT